MKIRSLNHRTIHTVLHSTSTTSWARTTQPVILQRLENAVLAVLLLIAYGNFGFDWWLLVVLFLLPDLSIFAYAKGNLFGAQIYNLAHTYTAPLLIAVIGFGWDFNSFIAIALIWAIHIALDRALGFGLKYSTSFKHNHLTWK